jgi:hypothetical protein
MAFPRPAQRGLERHLDQEFGEMAQRHRLRRHLSLLRLRQDHQRLQIP